MKIGIVLKDRCHEDALKCEFIIKGDGLDMNRLAERINREKFVCIERYVIATSEIKYIYKISN